MQNNLSDRNSRSFLLWSSVLKGVLLLGYMLWCIELDRVYKLNLANLSGLTEIDPARGVIGVLYSALVLYVFGSPFARRSWCALGCLLIASVLLFPFWLGSLFYDLHLFAGMGGAAIYLLSILAPWFEQKAGEGRLGQKERQACMGLVLICCISALIWAFDAHISGNMELFFCLSTSMYFYALTVSSP